MLVEICSPIDIHNCISDFIILFAHYRRVLIVNPLRACTSRFIAVIQLRCDRFDNKDVRNQLEKVRVL